MTTQPASDDRRRVERVLAGEGLLGGPRRVGAAPAPEETEDFAPRLRRACERLGPSFALFARYLGSRLDLLPAGDCAALAACPIAVFHARRRDGLLFVELVDRDLLAGLAELPALAPVLDRRGLASAELLADFEAAALLSLDLGARAAALESLAADAAGGLFVPEVDRARSTPAVLALADPGGEPLTEPASGAAWARRELARRVSAVWLGQALEGRLFTVEPGEPRILADGRIAWLGDTFSRLPLAAQDNVRRYLAAALDRDPDAAAAHLLAEMSGSAAAPGAEERLRLHLRQAVPFRDGAWSPSGRTLAEELFLHWRFARRCGYRPRAHLLAFWRGLAATEALCRRLAPEADGLAEAAAEIRFAAPWQRLSGLADVPQLREQLEVWTKAMIELPQKLDAALTAAAERPRREPPAERPEPGAGPSTPALLLGLAAVALLVPQLAGAEGGGRLAAALLLVLGALLLRSWRRR